MDKLLRQLAELINELQLPGEEDYLLRLFQIQERLRYPQMRLAVIGNFSCGKSTFLNAMLKRPLLSMANMPTTAVPTYIDWCGKEETLQITVRDTEDQLHLLDAAGKAWFYEHTGTALSENVGEMLDFLTTSNSLHDLLSSVHISFPQKDGYPGYCLIDTPGINPGDEEAAGHILHTQDILRDEADAAIVLFPSYCAYTRDFSDFLEQNARHLLANSIFVVTKIDIVPTEHEREKLIQFVKANLNSKLGLEEPQVYCCSAGCALESYTGSTTQSQLWAQTFEGMIKEIFDSLEPRRLQMASNRTFSMIIELINALGDEIERKQEELYRLLQNLEKYSYEELQRRYLVMYKDYTDKARAAKTRVYQQMKSNVTTVTDGAVSKICRGIDQCGSKWAINSYVKKDAKTITDETTAKLKRILEQSYGMFQENQHAIYTVFSYNVEQLLFEFDFLMGSLQGVAARLEKKSPVKKLDVDLNIQLKSEENEIWANLAMFTGGIVAVSGGWVLALAGIILSSLVGLPSVKARVNQEIKEKLYAVKKSANQHCNQIGDHMVAIHINSAKELMLEYQKTYRDLFERKKEELERYRQKVEEEIERNSRCLKILEKILVQMREQASNI